MKYNLPMDRTNILKLLKQKLWKNRRRGTQINKTLDNNEIMRMKSNSATDLNIQFELLFRSFVCLFAIFKTLKTIMVNTVTIIGLRKSIGKHAKSFYHTHQTKWKATLYLHFVHSTFSFHSLHSTALHWIALNWYVNFLAQTESK